MTVNGKFPFSLFPLPHHLSPLMNNTIRSAIKAGLQSASIMSIADISTQVVIEGRAVTIYNDENITSNNPSGVNSESYRYDPKRTLRWAMIGLTLHGPYFFYSFSKLDRIFGASTSLSVAAKKTIFGQLVVFPPYLTALFTYMGMLEGMKRDDIASKVQDRVPKAFMSGCIFWPFANLINFSFVDIRWRVVYLAGVGGLWNGYLSFLNQDQIEW